MKKTLLNESYFLNFPELETERLLLRMLSLDDAARMQQIRSNKEVMKFMDSHWHTNIEISEEFISENLEMYSLQKGLFWALIEKESQQFIGDFAFWKIDKKHCRSEIGYTLHPDYWGKGYMNEAMRKILNFGFQNLKLHSIEANINPKNTKSRKILTKFGFVKEAYFRENYFYNGKFLDSEIYSLLEKNFRSY